MGQKPMHCILCGVFFANTPKRTSNFVTFETFSIDYEHLESKIFTSFLFLCITKVKRSALHTTHTVHSITRKDET